MGVRRLYSHAVGQGEVPRISAGGITRLNRKLSRVQRARLAEANRTTTLGSSIRPPDWTTAYDVCGSKSISHILGHSSKQASAELFVVLEVCDVSLVNELHSIPPGAVARKWFSGAVKQSSHTLTALPLTSFV